MRTQLLFRKIHKWVGLILAIQILLWFFSGFMMSFMPIEEIHGDHLLKPASPQSIKLLDLDLTRLPEQVNGPITALRIKPWLGQTVVEVKTAQQHMMFNTPELQPLTPINETQLQQVLAEQLLPQYQIKSINRLSEVPQEARGRQAPLYQVLLSGTEHPVIYVSEQTGEIVAKRVDRWRLFDFLWMLHIMDYDEREDFNHPLLYLTALSALLFTLTGFVLLFFTLKQKKR